jgi:hypothetical protein
MNYPETKKGKVTDTIYHSIVEDPYRWFVFKNNGLQNQNVLYKIHNLKSYPKILFDPNLLCDDGTIPFSQHGYIP